MMGTKELAGKNGAAAVEMAGKDTIWIEISKLTSEQLIEALKDTSELSNAILRKAYCIRRCDELGIEIPRTRLLTPSIVDALRAIADDRYFVGLFELLLFDRKHHRALRALPNRDQERLAGGEKLSVAIRGENGKSGEKKFSIQDLVLQDELFYRVIRGGRILSLSEQNALMDGEESKAFKRKKLRTITKQDIWIDQKKGIARIRGLELSHRDLLRLADETAPR